MKRKTTNYESFQDLHAAKVVEAETKEIKQRDSRRSRTTEPELTMIAGRESAIFQWQGFHISVQYSGLVSPVAARLQYCMGQFERANGPWFPIPGPRDKCNPQLRSLLQKAAGLLDPRRS